MSHVPRRRKHPSRQAAFTLVELSIVIVIVGLLTAGGLAVGAKMVERKAYIDTRTLIRQLEQSLKDYYVVNGHLPCAAPINARPAEAGYGLAVDCTASASGTWRDSGVRIGAVPTRTLGLPDSAAGDKFGSRFVYAVTEALTNTGDFGAADGRIIVRDVNDGIILTNAAFFIVSPGLDRKGAYVHHTASLGEACSPAADKDTDNCTLDNRTFRDAPFNNGDAGVAFFDDVTAWSPKFHFMTFDTQSSALWALKPGTQNIFSVGADGNTATTNVGIGTSDPQSKLHVAGVARASQFHIPSEPTSLNDLYALTSSDDLIIGIVKDPMIFGGTVGTSHEIVFMNADQNNSPPDDGISFVNRGTAGAQIAMRILGNGNVGVGTATPLSRLHVNGVASVEGNAGLLQLLGSDHAYVEYYPDGAGRKAWMGFGSAGDNNLTIALVEDNINLRPENGNVGINQPNPSQKLEVNGNIIGGCCLGLYNPSSPSQNRLWRLIVNTAAGEFSIGRRLDNSKANLPAGVNQVAPFIIQPDTPHRMLILQNNGTTAGNFVTLSDMRLKKDIMPIADVWDKLSTIRGVSFRYNDKQNAGADSETRHLGVLAQEVRAVFPEAVSENNDGYLMVSMDALVPVVIEALRELKQENADLKTALQGQGGTKRALIRPLDAILMSGMAAMALLLLLRRGTRGRVQ